MLPSRFGAQQHSANRKSRLEGPPRASLLPKPRRPGSTDRLSTEARRPSAAGHRSSSADPPRGTFGGRPSRDASATKLPLNAGKYAKASMTPLRSSHYSARPTTTPQGKYGQSSMTPRSSHYSSRPTTTPVRTPSEDRGNNWQNSLDRALAFVTIADQRPISTVAWQRGEVSRVGEALSLRNTAGNARGAVTLIRPLTIARFVDIAAALLAVITGDAKLNTDNYVTKLPHLSKRLLYPGTVSKSWLKTVNTLHAFPQALALIAYLLDLVNHIEMPVLDEWLYVKDDLASLRREYLYKCFIRFQDPSNGNQFDDLNEEHLHNLRQLLGNDEEKIAELTQNIKKYESCLEDELEQAARADEARREELRDQLLAALRSERAARRQTRTDTELHNSLKHEKPQALRQLDQDIERANAEIQQLKHEVETQTLSVEQRTKYKDEVEYVLKVIVSKQALAEQIAELVAGKESELARWQRDTLESCVEYKQRLISLSSSLPRLQALAVDENSLMSAACAERVSAALAPLRECSNELAQLRAQHTRHRSALARQRATLLEEARNKFGELKSLIQREQSALESESEHESMEAAAAAAELQVLANRLQVLQQQQQEYAAVDSELQFWENQDLAWRTKLSELQQYISCQHEAARRDLLLARERRVKLFAKNIALWNEKLALPRDVQV